MSATAAASRFDARWVPVRPEGRTARVGVAITATSWLLVAATVAVGFAAGTPVLRPHDFLVLYLGNALVWGGVAGLIVARGAGFVGVLLAAQAIGSGLSALLTVVARLPLDEATVGVLVHMADRFWLPGSLTSFAVLPILLTTRPLPRGLRVVVGAAVVVSVIPFALAPFRQREGQVANPFAIDDSFVQEVLRTVIVASFTAAVALAVVSLGVAMWRRWRGPASDRLGTGWIVVAQALVVVFGSPIFLPVAPVIAATFDRFAPVAPLAALLFMPAAVIVFSLGRRVGGIDGTVNRSAVNVLLVAALVGGYTAIATSLALVFPVPPLIAGVIGVAALALGLAPLQRWIQRRVDELVYGDAADPAQLVRRLGERLPDDVDGDDVRAVVDELRGLLRLASLELRASEPDGVRAMSGVAGGPPVRIPLTGSHGEVGEIVASAPGRQHVDRRAVRALERVSGVLAIAVRLAGVNREIVEAGERASEVALEERRMVGRELDEGLVPALARSSQALDEIPGLVVAGAGELDAAFAAVRADLAERTVEVRDLARTLIPGALDAGDIDTALRELAERFSSPRLTIDVSGSLGSSLAPGRMAAVHQLVAELVLLVRRAPDARRVGVAVCATPERITIVLEADGRGRADDEHAILSSLRDRVDDVGGTLHDERDGAGRRLAVELPR